MKMKNIFFPLFTLVLTVLVFGCKTTQKSLAGGLGDAGSGERIEYQTESPGASHV